MSVHILQEHTYIFFLGITIFGFLVGSFLNVVIVRIPRMLLRSESENTDSLTFNLAWPASHCPKCQKLIPWFNNIPLLSFLWLRGRCQNCHQKISLRYPLVELLTAILSLGIAQHFGPTLTTFLSLILVWSLIALAFIDFEHTILPDNITLPLLWMGLFINTFEIFTTASSAILGAMSGYLILWIIYWVFKLITHKEGMGYGDFKLLAMLGAWLGWQSLPFIILLSSFLGSMIGLSLILLKKKDKNSLIPFGPFLAIGGFVVLLWLPQLNFIYLKLFAL